MDKWIRLHMDELLLIMEKEITGKKGRNISMIKG